MFRKREDDVQGLFGNSGDATQTTATHTETAAPAQASPAVASTNTAAPAAAATAPSISRPFSEPRPAAPTAPTTAMFRNPASLPSNPAPTPGDLTRNRLPEAKAPSLPASITPTANPSNKSGRRVLTVGHDILLKGEIATCDRLVIEGKVDATLNDVHTVEIAEAGSFKGSANIEDAEISGLFEGDLTVRGLLVVRSTGRVRGKISFGEVEIERGGELTGEIKISGTQGSSTRAIRKESVAA